MTQKVLQVGSSAGVIIPKKTLGQLGLRVGDRVNVEIDAKQKKVFIEPISETVDKELLSWTRKFIDKYRPALEVLARK